MGKQRNRFVGNGKGKGKGKKSGPKKYTGIRYTTEEGEMYATVTKIFGGPQCEVICTDGRTYRCIIRAKFRGRRKRENHIETGTWVLVGIRDWGNSSNSKQLCDLLTVYTSNEKDMLKKSGTADFTALLSNATAHGNTVQNISEDNTVFIDQCETTIALEEHISKELAAKSNDNNDNDNDAIEDIFVDDI